MGPSGSDGSLGGTLQNTRNGAVAVVLVVVVVVAVVVAVVAAVVVVVVVAIPTSVLFGLGFQVRVLRKLSSCSTRALDFSGRGKMSAVSQSPQECG